MGWLALASLGWLERDFLALIDAPHVRATAAVAALGAAGVFGAAHALAPGHGKTMMAAYLVGTRARVRHAVGFGAIVAAMHTASAIALAAALLLLGALPATGRITAAMSVVASLVVAAVGAALVVTRLRRWRARHRAHERRAPRGIGHGHAGPGHGHGHAGHGYGHDGLRHAGGGHGHADPGVEVGEAAWSRRGLVALAVSGGLLPSPSAFLVLTTAFAMGRAGFGLALVGAFSLGLAGTLAAIGAVTLRSRDLIAGRCHNRPRAAALAGLLPAAGAAGVLAAGLAATTVAVLAW